MTMKATRPAENKKSMQLYPTKKIRSFATKPRPSALRLRVSSRLWCCLMMGRSLREEN